MFSLQKVHMFQRSVEAVIQRLSEAERSGGSLSAQGVGAKTDADIYAFRNQLKASLSRCVHRHSSKADRARRLLAYC